MQGKANDVRLGDAEGAVTSRAIDSAVNTPEPTKPTIATVDPVSPSDIQLLHCGDRALAVADVHAELALKSLAAELRSTSPPTPTARKAPATPRDVQPRIRWV